MSLNTIAMNNNPIKGEQFAFQLVSVNEQAEENPVSLLAWLNEISWLDPGSQEIHGHTGKSTHEIQFRLTGKALAYYPLLRGITASRQAHGVKLEVDHPSRNFICRFDRDYEKTAYNYLSVVLGIIEEEIRFKGVLKMVIDNQMRFLLEEKLLLNQLTR